jgi:GNAT superfamily N-acetyltransferase
VGEVNVSHPAIITYMTFTIKRHAKEIPEIEQFAEKEWVYPDTEHYGGTVDWKPKDCIITAEIGSTVVGILTGKQVLGVLELFQLLVHHEHIRKGIGKKLMQEAEQFAYDNGAHRIYLMTGKGWEAEQFYQEMGYTQRAEVPYHFVKKTFIMYEKYIKENMGHE